jgi:ABC-type branched-subunit amino acid transport system ATPase component
MDAPGGSLLLEVTGLTKEYGGLAALAGVSFGVRPGEIVGIIGPNGAGKTTLFDLLGGFIPPTSGSIRFRGASTAGVRPDRLCRLGIARTFQVARPFPGMTVFENVMAAAVFGKNERSPASGVRRQVEELLAATGLSAAAELSARALNPPQRKRLELARALATRPALLLLDEALAGLNPREVEDALPLIRSLSADRKITILLIEHNIRAIVGLSHRVLVLDFGRLIFDGAPEDAARDPGVVRAYLGESGDA